MARLVAPELMTVAGATRYVMATHLLEEHGATAGEVRGCERCAALAALPGVHPVVVARWRQHHYATHPLDRHPADATFNDREDAPC